MPGSSPTAAIMSRSVSTSPQMMRRVVERIGDGGRRRQQRAHALGRVGSQGGQLEAAALRLVGPEPRVASRAGEDGQPAVAARARAADRERLGQLEQLVHVVRPRGAGLLHQRAEGGVVAGHRAGVRRGGARPGGRGPDLEHRDADAGVGAQRQRLAQPRAVAVALQEEGDRAHAVALGDGVQPVAGVDDGLVAARDHGVQAQAAPRRQRVDRDVAALRDDRHVAGLARHERVAPQRRAVVAARRSRRSWARTPAGRGGRPRRAARPAGARRRASRRSPPRRRRRRRTRARRPARSPRARPPPGWRRRPRRRARAGRPRWARTCARARAGASGARPTRARGSPMRLRLRSVSSA